MSKQATTEHEKAVAKIAAINKRIGKKLGNEAIKQGNAAIVANAIVAQLDALSVKREQWESTDYKKANEGLYALLSECLSLYQCKFVSVNNDERKALREGLTNKLTAAGVKVQKNTTTLTMLVRYVFSSDRKRAHGYAAVLIAALSHIGGDWGDLDAHDVAANVHAVQHDERILSAYKLHGEKFYVITEWDRTATTLLLASEY